MPTSKPGLSLYSTTATPRTKSAHWAPCSLVGWSLLVDRFPSAVVTCGSALPLTRATHRLEAADPLDRHRPTVHCSARRWFLSEGPPHRCCRTASPSERRHQNSAAKCTEATYLPPNDSQRLARTLSPRACPLQPHSGGSRCITHGGCCNIAILHLPMGPTPRKRNDNKQP